MKNVLFPSSRLRSKAGKQPATNRALCLLDACLVYSSILKMEAPHSSKISVNFQQAIQCHIPKHIPFIGTTMRTSNVAVEGNFLDIIIWNIENCHFHNDVKEMFQCICENIIKWMESFTNLSGMYICSYICICSSFLWFKILNVHGFAGGLLCGIYKLIQKGSTTNIRALTLM